MADHHFSVEIAVEFGVNAAILFQNIHFWCEKNRANGMNLHDGLYWTYNSRKAFRKLFPYMSEKQIKAALDKLIENGLITTGTYNEDARDRTLWYAVTKKGDCIFQNGNMEMSEKANANAEKDAPLPYIKQTDINTDINNEEEESAGACEEVNPYGEDGYRGPGEPGRTTSSEPPLAAHLPLKRGKAAGEGFVDTVQAYALNNLRVMTPGHMQEFNEFMTVHGVSEKLMLYAIDVACGNGAPVWNYVAQVLYGWLDAGVKSVGDAKAEQEKHRKKRDGPVGNAFGLDRRNNKVPEQIGKGIVV